MVTMKNHTKPNGEIGIRTLVALSHEPVFETNPESRATHTTRINIDNSNYQDSENPQTPTELKGRGPLPRPTIETWRAIPGHGNYYEASTHGRIRRVGGHPLSPRTDRYGYQQVSICADGEQKQATVHTLVMAAFVGPCPDGATVNHIDTIKSHNWLTNLEFMTRGDNIRQGFSDGAYPVGERHPSAKLTAGQAQEIRSLIGTMPATRIAKRFGVSNVTISKIRDGKTWRQS